jgi:hypothetical protein
MRPRAMVMRERWLKVAKLSTVFVTGGASLAYHRYYTGICIPICTQIQYEETDKCLPLGSLEKCGISWNCGVGRATFS